LLVRGIAAAHATEPENRAPEDPVRLPGAQELTAPAQDRDRLGAPLDPAQELVPKPGFTGPRGRGDHDRARLGVLDAARELPFEGAELRVASHARRGLAEQRPALVDGGFL